MRFDLFDEIGFRLCAYQFVDYLAAFDEQDGGDAGNTVIDRQLRIVVYIDFPYIDLSVIFFGQFFDNRSDSATRAAPFCPEIDYGELIGGNHFFLKVGIC